MDPSWFIVYVNGHPFAVHTSTAEDAMTTATVILAAKTGCRRPGRITEIARFDA